MNARATEETKSLLKEAPPGFSRTDSMKFLEPDSSGFFAG
jgi:hypothetical protein